MNDPHFLGNSSLSLSFPTVHLGGGVSREWKGGGVPASKHPVFSYTLTRAFRGVLRQAPRFWLAFFLPLGPSSEPGAPKMRAEGSWEKEGRERGSQTQRDTARPPISVQGVSDCPTVLLVRVTHDGSGDNVSCQALEAMGDFEVLLPVPPWPTSLVLGVTLHNSLVPSAPEASVLNAQLGIPGTSQGSYQLLHSL